MIWINAIFSLLIIYEYRNITYIQIDLSTYIWYSLVYVTGIKKVQSYTLPLLSSPQYIYIHIELYFFTIEKPLENRSSFYQSTYVSLIKTHTNISHYNNSPYNTHTELLSLHCLLIVITEYTAPLLLRQTAIEVTLTLKMASPRNNNGFQRILSVITSFGYISMVKLSSIISIA